MPGALEPAFPAGPPAPPQRAGWPGRAWSAYLRVLAQGRPPPLYPPPPSVGVLSADEALEEELDQLGAGAGACLRERLDAAELSALCLSGGGIRSAAFCLGVMQGLARRGVLTDFDYLSTVSGGGFAGGWLQMMIGERGLDQAQAELAKPGPGPLRRLRGFTNYLTPRSGPFSSDTWAGVVLYLRNLILCWMVLLPSFLLVPLALVFHRTLIAHLHSPSRAWLPMLAGSLALLAGTFHACVALPSHRPAAPGGYAPQAFVTYAIVAPTLAWALLVPGALVAGYGEGGVGAWDQAVLPTAYLATMVAAYAIAAAWQRWAADPGAGLYAANAVPWLAASAASALLLLALVEGARAWIPTIDVAQPLTAFGPMLLVVAHLLQSVLFVGLRREALRADLDREWLARLDGQVLRFATAWTALGFCCLVLSELLIGHRWQAWSPALLTGPLAAWIGKQVVARIRVPSPSGTARLPVLPILKLLAVAFAVVLFALFGAGLQALLGWLQLLIRGCGQADGCPARDDPLPLLLQLGAGFLLLLAASRFGAVNVNRFSMHAVYRNRLTRAFLGSARASREPDPFTGFDEADNPRLKDVGGGARRLFPVINLTLNLTAVRRAAWSERKAAPFTATPLACGSAALRPSGAAAAGAYLSTPAFAGMETRRDLRNAAAGARLGSLLTISGAAVSPNWGYHSSPTIAFLMTLFNVRLGAWLPNPAVSSADDARLAKPRNSLLALLHELLGQSTDVAQSVYLSDGGHFDNLGLYEMLRRRCSLVVVVDAGQDEHCSLSDLGGALRMAEIDGLARVELDGMRVRSRAAIELGPGAGGEAAGHAVGRIRYPGSDRPGELVYLKPSFLPGIPPHVRSYGVGRSAFPHESTINQAFTESQFESYRALGSYQADLMFGA